MPLTTTTPELELRAITGDPAAFGEVIRAHDRALRGLVWGIVRDPHAIDDVMQSSYEKAFGALASFDGRSALKTWLHSICYRTALDHIRYETRRAHDDIADAEAARPAPAASAAAIARTELAAALDKIDPATRAMLMLTAGLGYSYDEVALITGEPRGTIASKVSRARKEVTPW